MRARMAIHIAKINVEHIEVSLKEKPKSLLDHSPKGTVPVVVTADGTVLEQSRDIMHWALAQSDPDDWLLKDSPLAQQAMASLVDICDIDFKPLLDRYKYHDRYPEQSQVMYRQQAELFLQQLEERLAKADFLMDNRMRFADVAIFPFVRQFAGVDNKWFADSDYHNLQRWLDACVTSDLFSAIMHKEQ
jgi:glutathione S-transferase